MYERIKLLLALLHLQQYNMIEVNNLNIVLIMITNSDKIYFGHIPVANKSVTWFSSSEIRVLPLMSMQSLFSVFPFSSRSDTYDNINELKLYP